MRLQLTATRAQSVFKYEDLFGFAVRRCSRNSHRRRHTLWTQAMRFRIKILSAMLLTPLHRTKHGKTVWATLPPVQGVVTNALWLNLEVTWVVHDENASQWNIYELNGRWWSEGIERARIVRALNAVRLSGSCTNWTDGVLVVAVNGDSIWFLLNADRRGYLEQCLVLNNTNCFSG